MHHLIFEGAELAGKSWLMSQIYDRLEPRFNKAGKVLDGCHWFNCDVGIFGTEHGRTVICHYLKIFEELKEKNILVEKLYLADKVYNRLHRGEEINYSEAEKILKGLDFKTVVVTFPEDMGLLKKRIQDRLNIYPHYERILQDPEWYIEQQREYMKELKKTDLPYLIVETKDLPDNEPVKKILDWIGF